MSKEQFQSPHLLTDDHIRSLGVRDCDIEMYRRKHYQSQFGIDTWYDALKDHTFRTECFPLTFEEATIIVASHRQPLQTNQQETLQKLEQKIDRVLEGFPNGSFVKLSTRSPKDVFIYDFKNPRVQRTIDSRMGKIPGHKDDHSLNHRNQQLIQFVIATTELMKVTNGAEAIEMLLKSTRIYEDLTKYLQFGEKLFDISLIVREWLQELPEHPEMEFRAFVHNNELTAITQYYSFCYFEELNLHRQRYLHMMSDFFETIKDKLNSHCSYVIDFYIDGDTVKIIELNPFHSGAGAGLYSWKTDRDILMNGPLELRVLPQIGAVPLDPLPIFWQKYLGAYQEEKLDQEEESESAWNVGMLILCMAAFTGGYLLYKRRFQN